MPRASTETGRDRGRPLDPATRRHGHAATPATARVRHSRRAPSAHTGVLQQPHWKIAAEAGHDHAEALTSSGAGLAVLEQPAAILAPQPVAARHHILIVEDDPQVATVIRETLQLEGEADWAVQTASEGGHALALASTTPPDVVLLDVRLPGLDGAEVYRRLRAEDKTRRARILFLSAGTSYDLHQRGIEDGVLLRKPFDVQTLVGLVRALVEG